MYNLTENQKNILKWIVEQVRKQNLEEDFHFVYTGSGSIRFMGRGTTGKIENIPYFSTGTMHALREAKLILFQESGERYTTYRCTLLGDAYKAVDSNFEEKVEISNSSRYKSVFGEPNKRYMHDIFVLMPFSEELKPVFENHIKPIAQKLDLSITRADDFFSQNSIIEEIWSAISQATILIADGTNKNPNVFYEIGIAHAIGKPVIVITQNHDDIPFDLRHRRYIHYLYTPPGMQKFENDLYQTLLETLKDLDNSISPK